MSILTAAVVCLGSSVIEGRCLWFRNGRRDSAVWALFTILVGDSATSSASQSACRGHAGRSLRRVLGKVDCSSVARGWKGRRSKSFDGPCASFFLTLPLRLHRPFSELKCCRSFRAGIAFQPDQMSRGTASRSKGYFASLSWGTVPLLKEGIEM